MSRRTFKIRTTEGKVREIAVPEKPRRALGEKRTATRAREPKPAVTGPEGEGEKGAEDGKRQR